jgi:hypothetical protein
MSTTVTEATSEAAFIADDSIRLDSLPKELGVLFVVAGIGGILLPGPIGAPFLVVGGVVLWPKLFHNMERGFEKRFPRIHREGMKQLKRFVVDLEKRYPSKSN